MHGLFTYLAFVFIVWAGLYRNGRYGAAEFALRVGLALPIVVALVAFSLIGALVLNAAVVEIAGFKAWFWAHDDVLMTNYRGWRELVGDSESLLWVGITLFWVVLLDLLQFMWLYIVASPLIVPKVWTALCCGLFYYWLKAHGFFDRSPPAGRAKTAEELAAEAAEDAADQGILPLAPWHLEERRRQRMERRTQVASRRPRM